MRGFYNRMLIIDVTSKTSKAELLPDRLLKARLGGKGLGSHLLLLYNPPGIDPFSPDNHLIIAAGPAAGTAVWGSCRYGIFTKSPQTGLYSESYSGGRVPEAIDSAGYDAILIRGKSDRLLVLHITPERVLFHDAENLRGKDTYETEDQVRDHYAQAGKGLKNGAIVIGPAGENRVRFSVVENDYWRSAGRTGTGAVMGAKGIKAILFTGNRKRSPHDRDAVKALSKQAAHDAKDNPAAEAYKTKGTTGMVRVMNLHGAFPSRYWSEGTYENWEKISAEALHERFVVNPHTCLKCFLACGRLSTLKYGRHAGLRIEGPEYETIFAFGGLCCIDSIEEIAYLNDLCDRLGMDTISCGNLCAFTIEAARRRKIDLEIDYGDVDSIARLIHRIAYRKGVGDIIARGIRFAARTWGMEDMAMHVKGLEPPGYDPRVLKGMGLGYATSDRGACHLRSTFYKAELSKMIEPDRVEGKAELFIDFEDRLTIFDSLILCRFYRDLYPWESLGEIIYAITGLALDRNLLRKTASAVSNEVRRFNLREGLTRADDNLPIRFYKEPLKTGQVITPEEMSAMLADYYRLRGWDEEGHPPTMDSNKTFLSQ